MKYVALICKKTQKEFGYMPLKQYNPKDAFHSNFMAVVFTIKPSKDKDGSVYYDMGRANRIYEILEVKKA